MERADEPNLNDLLALLRRGLLPAFVAALLAGGIVFVVSDRATPQFVAESVLVVSNQDPNTRDFGTTLVTAPTLAVATYRGAGVSRQVLGSALATLDGASTLDRVEALGRQTTVRSEDAGLSAFLRIAVRGPDPARVRDLANAVATATVQWDVQRATDTLDVIVESLEAEIRAVEAELEVADAAAAAGLATTRAQLSLQLSSASALKTAAVGRVALFERAEVPTRPVSPRPALNAALAGALAVILVYALLVVRSGLDTRVRRLDELARATGLPVLAAFPLQAGGRMRVAREPSSYLRTAVAFAAVEAHPKILLVTSAVAGQGKSTVSIALAAAFARQHQRTLLIDADLRDPVIGKEFDLNVVSTPTLQDVMSGHRRGGGLPTRLDLAPDTPLDVIPGFQPASEPTELLATHFERVLTFLAPYYDVIVIDSAPLLPVADTLAIAPHVSGTLLVADMANADRRHLADAQRLLNRVGAPGYGVVATRVRPGAQGGSGYGYGTGYGYGQANGDGTFTIEPVRVRKPEEFDPRPKSSA